MSRKKRKHPSNFNFIINKAHCNKKKEQHVEKRQEIARRYELFHDKFLDYEQIVEYLQRMEQEFSQKVKVLEIGLSTQGKKIYMVAINNPTSEVAHPKSAVMIEAGLNGKDWMAVSNALYIIDHVVKNPQGAKVMDVLVIPCSNPDAYADSFNSCARYCSKKSTPGINMDLTSNFPVMLGVTDPSETSTKEYLLAIQHWKEKYAYATPECNTLMNTIYSYQFTVKLFISLQQGGRNILYPFGFGSNPPTDVEDLKAVAWSGKNAMKTRSLEYGSVYDLCGLSFGNILDFLRIQKNVMKYSYIIQVTKSCDAKDVKNILRYGCETVRCINAMCAAVFKFYNKVDESKPKENKKRCP